ncbi:MAG: HyaD/HybD family hydrogenase maturation endopeptidase [Gammaproteobacteria bacterium]|nr:HyaD/HybD family hydrogenase maturation endopeptidase [Gammaproteobacteria bacterium]
MGIGTLILGIGNTLLTDEGVGIHVLKALENQGRLPADVTFMDGGTLSFTLAGPIEDCARLIAVDAAELKQPPGSIRVFEGADMDTHVAAGGKRSVHEVSLADVLGMAALAGRLPPQRALVGIQPKYMDWGDGPTPEVEAVIPDACRAIGDIIARWYP